MTASFVSVFSALFLAVTWMTVPRAQPTTDAPHPALDAVRPEDSGSFLLNTIIVDDNNVEVSQFLEPILTYRINDRTLTVFKRQGLIFADGFDNAPTNFQQE